MAEMLPNRCLCTGLHLSAAEQVVNTAPTYYHLIRVAYLHVQETQRNVIIHLESTLCPPDEC